MTNKEIKIVLANEGLRIYISDILHLCILDKVCSIQSWLNDDYTKFSIEYQTFTSINILTEYTDKSLWIKILKQLDKLY